MKKGDRRRGGNLSVNRRATHDYHVLERLEAGIELVGTEVKVVRNGEASLSGSFASVQNGELFLHQFNIPPYAYGNRFNHDTARSRRLLVHKREVLKLKAMAEQKGFSLIPLRLYLSPRGLVKVEIGVCLGKAKQDKREAIRRRDADMEARRAVAQHYRG